MGKEWDQVEYLEDGARIVPSRRIPVPGTVSEAARRRIASGRAARVPRAGRPRRSDRRIRVASPALSFQDVGEVAQTVESGGTMSEALAAHPKVFSPLYVNMVRAGEAGGWPEPPPRSDGSGAECKE